MSREGGGGLSKVTSFKIPSQEYLLERGDIYVFFFRESANDIDLCTFNKKDMKFQAHYLKGRVPRLLLKRGRPAALTGANSFYQKKILH